MLEEDQEKYGSLKERVEAMSDLAATMDRLIASVVEEIDRARGQVFDVLENIAFYEMQGEFDKKGTTNEGS